MKYDMNCKVYKIVFSKLLKQYYKEMEPERNISKMISDINKEYKKMILRIPSLSKDNLMVDNLKGAAYFFAMAKIIPNMTPVLLDEMIDYAFSTKLMKKIYAMKKKKDVVFSEKAQEKMYQDSLRSQKSNDEMDWKFTYIKGKDEVKYIMTKCGVCRLAKREHLEEYLPCMCKMDYPKYKLSGATLYRTMTLANNDECCDFHLVKNKK